MKLQQEIDIYPHQIIMTSTLRYTDIIIRQVLTFTTLNTTLLYILGLIRRTTRGDQLINRLDQEHPQQTPLVSHAYGFGGYKYNVVQQSRRSVPRVNLVACRHTRNHVRRTTPHPITQEGKEEPFNPTPTGTALMSVTPITRTRQPSELAFHWGISRMSHPHLLHWFSLGRVYLNMIP